MPIKEQPRKEIKSEISNALLRLASLYQLSGFAEDNAFVLADWILDNLKHKKMEIVIETLKNPPVLFENGEVLKNWRLTPDTVYAWIDKKSKDMEALRQEQRSREGLDKVSKPADLSPEAQETIKKYLDDLQKNMFKRGSAKEMSPELERIDMIMKLMNQYRKENFDPITGKLKENALDERDWLLDKGYFFDNGELKKI